MPIIDQFYKNKINYYVNSHEQEWDMRLRIRKKFR